MILSGEELQELSRLIHQEIGLVYEPNKWDILESRLKSRLQHLPGVSPHDYVRDLARQRGPELRRFLDLVTINETYFFRELPQLDHFARYVLPPILEEKCARQFSRLRVWSAGSSIGCEAYTLAILIHEALEAMGHEIDWLVEGTDISESCLSVGQSGLYNERELKEVPPAMRRKYFEPDGQYFRFQHPCKQKVRFRYANLLQPGRDINGPFDVIFCRNVFIYFDDPTKRRVTDYFYDMLAPGGVIFLGSSESMSRISRSFELRRVGPGLVYTKA